MLGVVFLYEYANNLVGLEKFLFYDSIDPRTPGGFIRSNSR